jgi:hypothetical protein
MKFKDCLLLEIIEAHKRYVAWWLPIDLACDSCMGAMCFQRFCEALLTYDDVDWWERWIDKEFHDSLEDNKTYAKRCVLDLLTQHAVGQIDLNRLTCSLEHKYKSELR